MDCDAKLNSKCFRIQDSQKNKLNKGKVIFKIESNQYVWSLFLGSIYWLCDHNQIAASCHKTTTITNSDMFWQKVNPSSRRCTLMFLNENAILSDHRKHMQATWLSSWTGQRHEAIVLLGKLNIQFNGIRWPAVAPPEGDKRREENICIASSLNTFERSFKPDIDGVTYFFFSLVVTGPTGLSLTERLEILFLCPPTYWKAPCMKWY